MLHRIAYAFDAADFCYLYGNALAGRVADRVSVKTIRSTVKELLAPLLATSLRSCEFSTVNALFFATTKNQIAALVPVADELKKRGLSVRWLDSSPVSKNEMLSLGPRLVVQFYIALLCQVLLRPCVTTEAIRKVGGRRFVSAFFYFFWSVKRLKGFKGGLFFSNDHSLAPRSVMKAAKLIGLKTIYIQHAAVTEIFPPLEYELSFLDGEDAKKIYKRIAKNNNVSFPSVYVFGSPKMDSVFQLRLVRKYDSYLTVGVAVNALDNYLAVREYIKILVSEGFKILLRLHPRQKNLDQYECIVTEFRGMVEVFKDQGLADYLISIDFNLSGNSSIHLEAVASGIATFYCDFGSSTDDYYGFVANGVAMRAETAYFGKRDFSLGFKEIYLSQSQALSSYFSNTVEESAASLIVDKYISVLDGVGC